MPQPAATGIHSIPTDDGMRHREDAMATRIDDTTVPLVACEECLKRIPKDEAQVSEAADYVAYFCGLDCFQKWRAKADEKNPPKA
jgi:hypothetical protein